MNFRGVFRAVLLLGVLHAVTSETDYCSKEICEDEIHVACNHSGGFASTCPSDAKVIELADADITTILNEHNWLRNKIASGQEKGFNTAARMTTLTWNKDLAKFAELNARSCKLEHDKCRNTEKLKYAGQNIAMTSASNKFPELPTFLNHSIHDWYSEVADALQSDMDKFESSERVIGHMTQIVNDKSNEVGCAAVQYTEEGWKNSILVCNYARTNIVDGPIYVSGEPASQCTTGKNGAFGALCSADETVDPNL